MSYGSLGAAVVARNCNIFWGGGEIRLRVECPCFLSGMAPHGVGWLGTTSITGGHREMKGVQIGLVDKGGTVLE